MTNDDRFRLFLSQIKENWAILVPTLGGIIVVSISAARAQDAIDDQGARLTAVEAAVVTSTSHLSVIDERSRITLELVKSIDQKLDRRDDRQ